MTIDLRKTATDAAYIVVGAGVLGFQQAQVRRREARARLTRLRDDARGSLGAQAGTLKTQAAGIASGAAAVGTQVRDQVTTVAGTVDPRIWIQPVVGDVRSRVEPVVEQLRGVPGSVTLPSSLTDAWAALPAQVSEQVNRAVQAGRIRVRGAAPES